MWDWDKILSFSSKMTCSAFTDISVVLRKSDIFCGVTFLGMFVMITLSIWEWKWIARAFLCAVREACGQLETYYVDSQIYYRNEFISLYWNHAAVLLRHLLMRWLPWYTYSGILTSLVQSACSRCERDWERSQRQTIVLWSPCWRERQWSNCVLQFLLR